MKELVDYTFQFYQNEDSVFEVQFLIFVVQIRNNSFFLDLLRSESKLDWLSQTLGSRVSCLERFFYKLV